MRDEAALRWALASLCRGVVERDLSGPLSSGNASLVDERSETIAVTSTGVAMPDVEPGNVVLLRVDRAWRTSGDAVTWGPPEKARLARSSAHPSSELPLHLAAYRARPEIRVVLHVHAPWTVAASCLDLERLPFVHYHQAVLGEAMTPVVPYATPGSDELAALAREAFGRERIDAALLASHGAVITAETPEDVLDRAEVLEDVCRLVVLTHGRARELEATELPRLRNLFRTYRRG